MKDFGSFKIAEWDDIMTAAENVERFCKTCEAEMLKDDPEDKEGQIAAFRRDVTMVVAAACVAAQVAEHQGGLAMVPSDLTEEQQEDVEKQLDKLRREAARASEAPVQ